MVHRIRKEMYNTSSSGYAGNDDCGEMSAWYLFSALGFYHVNPVSGEYYLGTPTFDKAIVHLPSGKDFTVTASRKKPDNHLVKKVELDGRPFSGYILPHSAITEGSNLNFTLK